jgi:hypothetical protein
MHHTGSTSRELSEDGNGVSSVPEQFARAIKATMANTNPNTLKHKKDGFINNLHSYFYHT